MRTDNRLPRVLHILLHLDEIEDPITSEQMGEMFAIDPSLIRRTMGGLRAQGLVGSIKGHGGGWRLARPLGEISLMDVYQALGPPALFAIGVPHPSSTCLLEKAANEATGKAMQIAREALEAELQRVSVADLAKDIPKRSAS